MRKILLSILLALLVIVAGLTMKNGISLGSLHILGFQDIAEENQELTTAIEKAKSKEEEYSNEVLPKLSADTSKLATAKKEYLDLVTVSTDSEIQQALQTKTYTIEYLWSQVGNHATKEGVVTKMELTSSNLSETGYKNLNFTVTGNYLAITNFISDLENDTSLDFTIDNFDMTNGKCTFVVKDIKIQKEATTQSVVSKSSTENTTGTSKNNSNEVQQ